jgi:methylated-DNA-protein-cysteine methyltransferase-like protein
LLFVSKHDSIDATIDLMRDTSDVYCGSELAEAEPIGAARAAFSDRVFSVVARIPFGRVTTYGAIARSLGAPRAARTVGWAMRLAPGEARLPCHRVVDRNGFLSGGWHFGHPDIMAGRLHDEAIPFLDPYRVDLAACFWDPSDELYPESEDHDRIPDRVP